MVKKVVAIFRPEINNGISGVVLFTQKTNGTQVEFDLSGFKSGAEHAVHIHEYGDLRQGCKSLGGHFNPYNSKHGSIEYTAERHAGDLINNLKCDVHGCFQYKYLDDLLRVEDLPGRSVVIHRLTDDYGLQGIIMNGNVFAYKAVSTSILAQLSRERGYPSNVSREKLIRKLNRESRITGNAGQRMGCAIIGIAK